MATRNNMRFQNIRCETGRIVLALLERSDCETSRGLLFGAQFANVSSTNSVVHEQDQGEHQGGNQQGQHQGHGHKGTAIMSMNIIDIDARPVFVTGLIHKDPQINFSGGSFIDFAGDPVLVVDALEDAATSISPQSRYFVGWDAKFLWKSWQSQFCLGKP